MMAELRRLQAALRRFSSAASTAAGGGSWVEDIKCQGERSRRAGIYEKNEVKGFACALGCERRVRFPVKLQRLKDAIDEDTLIFRLDSDGRGPGNAGLWFKDRIQVRNM